MADSNKKSSAKVDPERRNLIYERAKRIQAARKNAEAKKNAEERRARMVRRGEEKNKKNAEEQSKDLLKSKVISDDDFVDMAVLERKYKTLYTEKYKNRKFWINPNPNYIQSYIPGTIISIDTKEGKVVKEGTDILTLEAMKMQNKIQIPFTARIKKINVKVGDHIPKDFIMVELEPVN